MNAVLFALPLILSAAPARTPVLVELFTSEGCSSCPSADNALARLAQKQPVEGVELIALGFHVDYWDYLGWKDPYSSGEYSERQRRYVLDGDDNRMYTPQMVVDGQRAFVGGEDEARTQAAAAAQRPKVPLRLTARVEGETVVVRVRTEAAPAPGLELWAALAEEGLSSDVKRGENAGKKLSHAAVVRTLATLPPAKASEGSFVSEARLKLAAGWKRDKLRVVAVLQAPGGPVSGVASVEPAAK
ncbi:DUF1223 domain-containing protein [Hyalangium minutum]|uniref:DUF1223 domain-containing protein n=1 Tax=Hyalangium minutum TaxID=394096 RepID=A0A085VYU6_9BACT|nr:DUF1223 domain-containing protein [Hyalangium minutum]KFE60609.1 hypothetical protein DB31_5948 [Hyalangium minutum]